MGTSIPSWAYAGAEVACVRHIGTTIWGPKIPPDAAIPVKGKTYVIAEIETYRRKVFLALRGFDPFTVWDVKYFAPLTKTDEKSDLAIFRKIADDVPPQQLDLLPVDEPVDA